MVQMAFVRTRPVDHFADALADVYRGLLRIGWDEVAACEFTDGLNENRCELIKLRAQLAEMEMPIANKSAL